MEHSSLGSILLVDDDTLLLNALGRLLPGYRLYRAGNGLAALDVLHSTMVDLIFTDYQMPVMDGVTLLEIARQEFPGVRRVLTSSSPPSDLPRLKLAGVVEQFVQKPCSAPLDEVKQFTPAVCDHANEAGTVPRPRRATTRPADVQGADGWMI